MTLESFPFGRRTIPKYRRTFQVGRRKEEEGRAKEEDELVIKAAALKNPSSGGAALFSYWEEDLG